MQLHLEGSNSINAPRENVFALLTDPSFLAKTLPDAEDVRVLGPDSLEAKVKLRVAVVSSTLKMRLKVGEKTPPERATLLAEGTGGGSSLKIESVFELKEGASTTMAWTADAEITGVMAGIGSTLLRGFATRKVAEIFQGITTAVEQASK